MDFETIPCDSKRQSHAGLFYHKTLSGYFTYHLPCTEKYFILPTQYTGCTRKNVPDFGRVFLMLKYTDITQNTYIQSWTVTEIMAWEKCGLLAVPRTVPAKLTRFPYTAHVFESGMQFNSILLDIHVPCKVLGTLRTTTALVRVFM
jgi:hypothetical protein